VTTAVRRLPQSRSVPLEGEFAFGLELIINGLCQLRADHGRVS
jgi:hypothetical protein